MGYNLSGDKEPDTSERLNNNNNCLFVCFFFKDLMLLKKQNTILKTESRANPKMAEE